MEQSTRLIKSWDLSDEGRTMTVWWTEPSEKVSVPAHRSRRFISDTPWKPWQVTGILDALRTGVAIEEVHRAGDYRHLTPFARIAASIGDASVVVVDAILGRKSLAGGAR